MSKTRSTGEALSLLERTRSFYIAVGRYHGICLIIENGKTHTRDIRKRMEKDGIFNRFAAPDLKDFWLGSVFNHHFFTKVTDKHTYSDADRNIHERTNNVWTLTDAQKAWAWAKYYYDNIYSQLGW